MILLILDYIKAFAVGGLLCLIGQVLIDKTRLTPAKILTSYVVIGVLLELWEYISPCPVGGSGCKHSSDRLRQPAGQGIKKAIPGVCGIMTGGLTSAAAGVRRSILCISHSAYF